MNKISKDLIGFRGERIIELCLTNYSSLPAALFMPGFLGDKWPAIDFYVELLGVPRLRPYFFVQANATTAPLAPKSSTVSIMSRAADIERLMRIPAPTYIIGVHEPTERVFARSVHTGMPVRAVTRIPTAYELTSVNLQRLYNEVRDFWLIASQKPNNSVFA